ncbi:hypothetical protein PT2222_140198 [Paraburkholderia tropica]
MIKTIVDEKSLKECAEHNNKKAKNNDTQNQRQIKTSWWKRLITKN